MIDANGNIADMRDLILLATVFVGGLLVIVLAAILSKEPHDR